MRLKGIGSMARQDDTTQKAVRWQVESLRATTFHVPGAYVAVSTDTWEQVIGEQPDQVLTRPRQRVVQQSGTFEDKQLALVARQDRVDWIFQGMVGPPGEPMLGPPTLGPLPDALESFMRVTEKWLSVGPTITRIAFGAVLFISVKDLASAYQELSRFLPTVELGGTDSPDFLYQINRPRASKSLPEIRVNRMTKWSVIQGESISIGFRAGGGSVLASASPELACRLELDINTVPESMTSTHQARIQPLFNELVELGSEIAEKGDIP